MAGNEFAWGNAFAVGIHDNRCAMLVAVRDHQDIFSAHAGVAGKNIAGQDRADDLTDVSAGFRVGPRNTDKHTV